MGLTSTLTGTIYRDDGAVATGAVVTFTLCAPRNTHWTSNNRVVLRAPLTATTDGSGNFSQVVARNDQLTPDNTYWKVECAEAALLKHIAANADTLDVIVAPDLDASAQVFSGLDDPDDDWVAHGHVQTLTAAEKLQAATNLGLNLSASQLLGQASSGGTGLPVAVTLGTGLAMSGATLNATVTGTANEITVTGTTTPTLSLPSALTFTGKTVTGGTFASPSFTTPTIGDGTESAPSLSFTSDTNTGVYRPAADTVGIVGGGNDVVRMTGIASATDYLEIKNGIGVGSPLHVLAEGASANIGVHLQPKGSGLFTISDGTDFNKGIRFRSSSSAASAITLLDAVSTAGRVITLPDATGTLALVSGDLGTPSALVGTNITGTAASLTAGNATLAATVTVANEATDTTCFPLFATAATGSLAALSNAGLAFNSATGLLSATRFAGAFNGTVGATTPSTVAGTTITGTSSATLGTNGGTGGSVILNGSASGSATINVSTTGSLQFGEFTAFAATLSAALTTTGEYAMITTIGTGSSIFTSGNDAAIFTSGNDAAISTAGPNSHIETGHSSSYIQTASTFKLNDGTYTTTLSHAATANRAIAFPDAAGTLLLSNGSGANLTSLNSSNISSGTLAAARGGTGVSNTGTITLGGNLVTTGAFNTTFAQAATTTVTLPSTSATMARTDAAQTFTGVQSMTSPAITTSITTPSTTFAIANTTATTLNIGGAATTIAMGAAGAGTMNIPLTTSASSATTGALTIGNGTAATNVGIGGGNINAGGTIVAGGNISSQYITLASGRITINSGALTTSRLTNGSTSGWIIVDNQSGVGGAILLGSGSGNPGIFKSGTTLQVRLADNSADAPISASNVTASGTLAVTGATTLTGNLTSNGALISTPQALTGAGAVNVTTLTTAVTTTAPAQALTLANGTNGQIKTIVHQALSGGGTWVLTPTTKTGYTTITSTAVGETCTLQFFTTIGWCILSLRGAVAA